MSQPVALSICCYLLPPLLMDDTAFGSLITPEPMRNNLLPYKHVSCGSFDGYLSISLTG